jgi:hypothetical protein
MHLDKLAHEVVYVRVFLQQLGRLGQLPLAQYLAAVAAASMLQIFTGGGHAVARTAAATPRPLRCIGRKVLQFC